jgi:hypothetical protein
VITSAQTAEGRHEAGSSLITSAETPTGATRLRPNVIRRATAQRSESAWESVMRVLRRAADIPVEPQHEIFGQWGRFVARGDLWIAGTNRLHEFDGGKHRAPEVQSRDLTRSAVDRGRLPAIRLHQSSAAQRRSLHHRFDRQAAGSQFGSSLLRRWNALIADSMFGRRVAPELSAIGGHPDNCRPIAPPSAFSVAVCRQFPDQGESDHHLPSGGWNRPGQFRHA